MVTYFNIFNPTFLNKIMKTNYQQDKSLGLYLACSVFIILLISNLFTYLISHNLHPVICFFIAFFLSIFRLLAALASAFSASFFTSYLDAIGIIYIGRGDKIFIQAINGTIVFFITFFFVFPFLNFSSN